MTPAAKKVELPSQKKLRESREAEKAAAAKITQQTEQKQSATSSPTRAEIIAAHPIVEFVRRRGHKLKQQGENFVTSGCPNTTHSIKGHMPVTIYPATQTWTCHDCKKNGSVIDWLMQEKNIKVGEAMRELGGGEKSKLVKTYDYVDETGKLLFQACRYEPGKDGRPKDFKQRQPDGKDGWDWHLKGVRRVLYRLPEVIKTQTVCLPEGEKDADNLADLGFTATTNPMGAGKWRKEYAEALRGKDIVVFGDVGDSDGAGEKHTAQRLKSLSGKARSLKYVTLPDGFHDISDYIESLERDGLSKEAISRTIAELIAATPQFEPSNSAASDDQPETTADHRSPVTLDDFYAYMPQHNYIFIPSRDLWPAPSVNARIPPVPLTRNDEPVLDEDGEQKFISASAWLDQNQPVEMMTWAPAMPMIIGHRLISEGGWIERHGCSTFNLYRPPNIKPGDALKAGPWLDHVRLIYPDDAEHIFDWWAHRRQRPYEKINHALCLFGPPGIGKDTALYPVKEAVGRWNVVEIVPPALLGRFNGFARSVILCVNEVHDLGDVDRFGLYERLKAYTAAPPDVIRVDEKHLREYSVFNVCGVVLTSNYKTGGLYLPVDDRRHYVAWSDRKKEDFPETYWRDLYAWYDLAGSSHVAAYLDQRNLSDFNPKAPPLKTNAFWEIAGSNLPPETGDLADTLEYLGWPDAVTIAEITYAKTTSADFATWLKDRRNARIVPHRLEECGYAAVRNPDHIEGRWRIGDRRCPIYSKRTLSIRDQIAAARKLIEEERT